MWPKNYPEQALLSGHSPLLGIPIVTPKDPAYLQTVKNPLTQCGAAWEVPKMCAEPNRALTFRRDWLL